MPNLLINNKKLQINKRIRVYRNIRKMLFSVLDNKTRRLIDHRNTIVLSDVEFKVSKAGQARVRKEGQKHVHAYVVGNYISDDVDIESIEAYKLVYYNPYSTDTFILVEGNIPIFKAKKCYLINGKCYVDI